MVSGVSITKTITTPTLMSITFTFHRHALLVVALATLYKTNIRHRHGLSICTITFTMSQIQTIILDDNEVSRMMAEKAMHNQAFRIKLSEFVGSQARTSELQQRPKKFQWIVQIIAALRKQIADQVGLEAPLTQDGAERDLSTYLRRASHPKGLVAKADAQMEPGFEVIDEEGDHSWAMGMIGESSSMLESTCKLTLDLGTPDVCCTLGFGFPAVDAPVPGRPDTIPVRAPTC